MRLIDGACRDLRAVAVIRNPILREWSSERRRWRIRTERRQLTGISPDALIRSVEERGFDGAGNHRANIDTWRSVISDRLLILDFAAIASRPADTLRVVGAHIGYEGELALRDLGLVNANPIAAMPEGVREILELRYRRVIDEMRGEFPEMAQRWADGLE